MWQFLDEQFQNTLHGNLCLFRDLEYCTCTESLMQEAQDVLHAKGWVTELPFPFLFSLSYNVHCHSQETTAAPHPPTEHIHKTSKKI